MTKNFTYIDLFAGCGGFSLGLNWAGFKGIWAVEVDKDAASTYRNNIGNHIVCADIREIDTASVPKADLLVGGFPCQPFSISGLQHGFEGKDGDLFYQCVRFITDLKPKVFILENVTGFTSLKKGAYLKEALNVLRSLGYIVEWKVLNSINYEIPQVRQRLFIMGKCLGRSNYFPEPKEQIISVKNAIEDIRLNMDSFTNNDPMRHSERIQKRFAAVRPGETALDAMQRDPSLGKAKITKQCYRRLIADDPAPTIVANFVTTTIHYCENRNLTAREAARIQTFTDDFIFEGLRTRMSWQKGLSQYEQIGNAVPPKLSKELGKSVTLILEGKTAIATENIESKTNKHLQMQLNMVDETLHCDNNIERKISKRGRTSKYEHIYKNIELLKDGQTLEMPQELPEEFYIFLKGAMQRRKIYYTITDRILTKKAIQL